MSYVDLLKQVFRAEQTTSQPIRLERVRAASAGDEYDWTRRTHLVHPASNRDFVPRLVGVPLEHYGARLP